MADIAEPAGLGLPRIKIQGLFMPVAVVAVVMMLIIPLPTVLLDALMAFNLILSLLILLNVLYTQKATDFSIFPMILLVVTVFALALNVSSTRLILTQGARFDGRMIRAFSSFVVGSGGTEGLVVGFIIFIVIIAVQAIVITKGASRVSEVAARFTLDAMGPKQMAIEAEYNAGAITEEEANQKRREIQMESDFYGSMDGASKFISGNVVVGILITVINIIGGFIVGVAIHGESAGDAIANYISLSIGDGLLSQFPSLLVSTAVGVIVTRAASAGVPLDEQITKQFSRDRRIYWISAGVLLFLAILPGFPWYVLVPMAGLIAFYAWMLRRKALRPAFDEAAAKAKEKQGAETEDLSPVVPLDPLSLELGYGLIPLVDKDKGAELVERIQRLRKEAGLELGLVIPKIRIIDNMRLDSAEYCFKIKGMEVGRAKIRRGYYLCMNPGGVTVDIPGEKTVDPAFGLPATWIAEDRRDEAERAGYTVVDPPSIIATHITEIIRRHAAEILGMQETSKILEALKQDYPSVIEEARKNLSVGEIQKVLQGLLREQVSIRNTVGILEALAEFSVITKNVPFLIEKARQALARQICLQYADEETRTIRVLTINQALEAEILGSQVETPSGKIAAMDPARHKAWILALSRTLSNAKNAGMIQPIILCAEQTRALVKQSAEREVPDLIVLSVPEIVPEINVLQMGEIQGP
ncbi:MAG: flagellar biosynthesis protein FlhA [Spirochaetaceae bacterium]|nr:flagellar biosynthesis protein FlhA [Spirochaetaceae bacterium]